MVEVRIYRRENKYYLEVIGIQEHRRLEFYLLEQALYEAELILKRERIRNEGTNYNR